MVVVSRCLALRRAIRLWHSTYNFRRVANGLVTFLGDPVASHPKTFYAVGYQRSTRCICTSLSPRVDPASKATYAKVSAVKAPLEFQHWRTHAYN